ncbi:hypothetical protein ONZ51_g7481 [Trametes cubensis]|uniref:CxC2-like cysteine cluster KDZ transposase-associated domain-containing protein n=1 Tax=Trametes cubensis TaxID=1111947 RepID=A0AAD7TQH3_9APHY|nr:hypothetical protein ONZ51_g7481 [Trametes cubensis]
MGGRKRKASSDVPTVSRNRVAYSEGRALNPWAGVRADPVRSTSIPNNTSIIPGDVPCTSETTATVDLMTSASPKAKKAKSVETGKTAKVNNTIPPSERMTTFLTSWASRAQHALLEREVGPSYPICCSSSCDNHTACNTAPCDKPILATEPVYRCFDCYHAPIVCKECVVAAHTTNPLHRIEEWQPTLSFWQRRPLHDLGLVIWLGHGGNRCYSSPGPRKITVVHEHGIHTADIAFCNCELGADSLPVPEPLQLIKFGLFPGSWQYPQTAYTINGLRNYHLLSVQSPVTGLDFIAYLRRLTDNVQPDESKDRYQELNTAMREFSFLRNARRAGQEPTSGLAPGSLTLSCPACPQPQINMTDGWRDRPAEEEFLDMLFYSVDGNFHHNQKMKPMDPEDFPLTQGAGYFVNEVDFAQYQERMKPPQKEVSTCNKFGAMGYGRYSGRVSGMVGMTCSRHMFVIPSSLVDLIKGEGFAWEDFSQLSGLQPWLNVLKLLCRGYDINCQYDKKFELRLVQFRKDFSHLPSIKTTVFPPIRSPIPKFHGPAHELLCVVYRSYNYTPGVGMTDGEASERIWSAFNALAIRAKEMTAGHRHDVINDFLNDLNVRRVHTLPTTLATRHRNAKRQLAEASEHLARVEDNLADKNKLQAWRQTEKQWEEDVLDPKKHKKMNCPYLLDKDKGLTEKQLVEMMKRMRAVRNEQSLGPLGIIHEGTLLERRRDELLDELEEDDVSDSAMESIKLRCESFHTDLSTWNHLRDAYIGPLVDEAVQLVKTKLAAVATAVTLPESHPSVATTSDHDDHGSFPPPFPLRDATGDTGSLEKGLAPKRNPRGKPELWQELFTSPVVMPSSYHSTLLLEPCLRELVSLEREVRTAQARDALNDVRTAIIGREAYKIKKIHVSGKHHKTRATNHIRGMEDNVRAAANRYRRIRAALLALGMAESDPTLRPLCKGDTVKYTLDAQHKTLGESRER